jgi:hypothetical protein
LIAVNFTRDSDRLHVDPMGSDRLVVSGRHDGCGAGNFVRDGWWFGRPKALLFLSEVSLGGSEGLGEVFAHVWCG